MARAPEYLRPYLDALGAHGPGFESLLWTDRASQAARFEVIASLAALPGRAAADLGCGRADLWSFLGPARRPSRYLGIEAIPELALEAERVVSGAPGATIERADFVLEAGIFDRLARAGIEVLIFSGSLNTLAAGPVRRVLDAAWCAIERTRGATLVFNFLSDADDGIRRRHAGPTVMHDPAGWLRWALTRTTRVRLRHDYLDGRDATLAMDAC